MRFLVAASSAQGARDRNEDAWRVLPEAGVVALADGMGGLEDGAEMAAAATDAIAEVAPDLARLARGVGGERTANARRALFDRLLALFVETSRRLYARSAEAGRRMGTTLTALVLTPDRLVAAHVGDCRLIRLRRGQVTVLSTDHSVAAAQLRRGLITEEEYRVSPRRSLLYQSLGPLPEIEPDLIEAELERGDVVLLLSDGVWAALDDAALLELFADPDLERATARACQAALDRGSDDNCTAVALRIHDLDEPQSPGLLRALAGSPLFQAFSEAELRLLAPYLSPRDLLPGERALREGELGEEMLLIVSGALEVARQGVPLAQLGPGEHLGQLALAGPHERTASATAALPTRLLVLPREAVDELCTRRPDLGVRLLRALLADTADRVAVLSQRLAQVEAALWQA